MGNEILKLCMGKGFLLDKEMLDLLSNFNEEGVKDVIEVLGSIGIEERVITKSLFEKHFDKFRDLIMKNEGADEINNLFVGMGYIKQKENVYEIESLDKENEFGKVKILSSPAFTQKKVSVSDFVRHFRSRFESLKKILEGRNFDNLTSLRKIKGNSGSYTVIASVIDKRLTKNKNYFVEIEDMTGNSVVLVNQNRKEAFELAKELLVDDIVAFKVTSNGEILFADEIIYPDTSLEEKRYSDFDEYVAFISDVHTGSKMFLEKNLLRFVKWLNGEEGDEKQREIAKKVKYLFVNGDTVDGVSVFPGQDKTLEILEMSGQYDKLAEILKLVRKDIQIIIGPGQHDASWIGEPQPIIGEKWAEKLHKMENVTLIPNPCLIEIDGGFKILTYHGASMHGIIEAIPEIRLKHGHDNPTRVVKEMLKRRHLAPMHGSCDYIPCEKDPMVIDIIPDIITTGDQHRCEISIYNNILLIASSCWQARTAFEEKVGNNPDPCKVPLFNLKTRDLKVLDFSGSSTAQETEVKINEGMKPKEVSNE